MKILNINGYNYPRGGADRCFLELSSLLEAHGHEIIPFSMYHPKNLASPYEDFFVTYIDYPTELGKSGIHPKLTVGERILFSREAQNKLEKLVEVTQPDLVHIHNFIHEMSTSILPVLKKAGLPVLQTLHDYKIVCPNTSFISHDEICERCKGLRYYEMTLRRCKRGSLMASLLATSEMYFHTFFRLYEPNIDLFISPSDFLAHKVREHGITKPIVTIPNFIEPNQFQPRYDPEPYFILVGRLVKIKGVMTLLEAMRRLGPQVELRIAGTGEMEDEMRAFVSENNLNVKFLGHLATPELVQAVQNALATIQPSEWYENYSMTIIESLACGTPVIGSNIGGIPEQIIDGQNGFLFEPGQVDQLAEKMRFLLDNREIAIEMGRRGRQQVETVNSPEEHYRQTMRVYESVMTGVQAKAYPS